ncbi:MULTISPECIES: hypothetical protein [Halolamina]|uniref:Uncharacterized protein n=1 Tax=Halolamina pelagica TaxID=699431 RepID=A0A1I5VKM2_9EURY|nr:MULTISPECIES: hypothetical protein [Halolamina]NHX37621.1 hypothetical protein [Halolamina sp. R1-12]SFQ08055.1 hypothetical protein SAMN05216277_11853 [Halolamina pelagica]
MRRREYLQAAGAVAVGSTVFSASALAEHFDAKPDDVTLEYDESVLERYRPELVMPAAAEEKFIGLYGWVTRSEERETNVAVYWASYSHQEGWLGNLDSHYGDHEPVYVFFDDDGVTQVIASIYHWIAGRAPGAEIPLVDDTHPQLRVIKPWHQYTAAGQPGEFFDVDDLTTVFDSWLDNGLEESLAPGSVTNPWTMRSRPDWWRRGTAGFSINATLVDAMMSVGVGDVGSLSDQ